MFSERSLISKGNSSTTRILGGHSFIRDNGAHNAKRYGNMNMSMNMSNNASVLNIAGRTREDKLRAEEEVNEEVDSIQISEGMSQADPYDFGYFNIIRKSVDNKENLQKDFSPLNRNKSAFHHVVQNAIKKVSNCQNNCKFNLLKSMNEIEYDERSGEAQKVVKNKKDLIFNFAKEENDYKNFFVPSVSEGVPYNKTVGNKSRNLTLTSNKMLEEEIQQTGNSYIVKKQYCELEYGNLEHAHQLNHQYRFRKDRYEINLIMKLIKKYDDSNKPGKKVTIAFPEPYQELKKESAKLIEKYKISNIHDMFKLNEFRIESIKYLVEFIKRIEREVDDTPKKKNEFEVKKYKNYSKWKKKLSELVNIWELFSSNGIDLKFSIKYLILKKYLTARANKRQNDIDSGGKEEDNGNFVMQIIYALLGFTQSTFVPKSIFMPGELISILKEVFMGFFLIYSLFTIPLSEFLGYSDSSLDTIEKFVNVFFFVDLVTSFRKVYKDKSNEYVYDIKKIMKNYIVGLFFIDFFSTIPWYFFFLSNMNVFNQVKKWVMCFKIFRVVKLASIFQKLESLKGANYVRLFKLVFIFFFFAHWMGCIIFASITYTMDYNLLPERCYINNLSKNKSNITFTCKYFMTMYTAAYIIPGQYTNESEGLSELSTSSEYVVYIIMYMIGQVLAAYIFGGIASIIQNMNQGQNLFTNKMDMLNDHMTFYEVNKNTMKDVKLYYEYMWQRHKDVIYGKHHFDLLSRSLRERFERLNLVGNEILLAKFYNLNPGNTKLIGNILMNLSKVILFPYEILFEVGSVTKGIYILLNGDVELSNLQIQAIKTTQHVLNYGDIITLAEKNKKAQVKHSYYEEDKSVVFPLVSALIATGRNWQRCFSCNFTDLLFLPLSAFDQLISNFPIEMHILKHKIMEWVHSKKLFDNPALFKIISQHSSRSIGKYYYKEFDKISVWIPIPIPISQRKIAGNYINSFVKKVKNQWREILLMGDLNMCLNSYSTINMIKNSGKKEAKENNLHSDDPMDHIKALTKEISKLTEKFSQDFAEI